MECLQAQQKYPILRISTWENLKHKVRNVKLEIERQSVKDNLVKRNLKKGKKNLKDMADWMVYLTNNNGLIMSMNIRSCDAAAHLATAVKETVYFL